MHRKSFFLIVLTVIFMVSGISGTSFAKDVKTFEELKKQVGGDENAGIVDRSLKSVIKQQEMRDHRQVTVKNPRDIQIFNPRFQSISYDVEVKKMGSAKVAPVPGIFALLFEKEKSGGLSFYKSITLMWIGDKDVEDYKSIPLEKLAEYFREKGGEYVYVDKKVEQIKPEDLVLSGNNIKSGIIAEQFIDPAITRNSQLKTILDNYVLKSAEKPVAAPARDDSAVIQQLEARIKKLESLLANVTRSGNSIVFSNLNVVIKNGVGSTASTNGTGNLVVGYDEPSGSHNIFVGSRNRCSSYGSIVTGTGNVVSGKYAAIAGGSNNSASGDFAVVLGGQDNKASGTYSSILGGQDNKAKGEFSSINGQRGRTKVANEPSN